MTTAPITPSPLQRIGRRLLRAATTFFAVVGVFFTIWFITGTVEEVARADETVGGYEYPFQGWTGTPTDYRSWHSADYGLLYDGRVADLRLDCTSGQLIISVMSTFDVPFRAFSDRAKVVHQPQVACRERGFDTSTWDSIDDPLGLYTELTTVSR